MKMRNLIIALSLATVLGAGPAAAGELFADSFDGGSLTDKWEVLRPNADAYAVESGELLLLSSKRGALGDETAENVLMPKVELPAGDWTMHVKFSGEFQTAVEVLQFGIIADHDSVVWGSVGTSGDQYYGWALYAAAGRNDNGRDFRFSRNMLSLGCNVCGPDRMFPNFAATIPQPLEAKFEKRGHQFVLSAKAGADATQWTEIERITAIGATGRPFLLLRQAGDVKGETLLKIDSFMIESHG